MSFERTRGRTPRSRSWAPREGVLVIVLLGLLLVLAPALARAQVADSLTLRWTAPSDPGAGAVPVSVYDVRVSASLITSANFASATVVPAPRPGVPGTAEHVVIHGITAGQTYWFAIRSADSAGNWSALSNVVSWTGALDTAPPATPEGLLAGMPAGGRVPLSWAPGTEPDLAGYHVWRALDLGSAWSKLGSGLVTDTTFVDTNLPAGVTRIWYAVSAVDLLGNESARSTAVAAVLQTPSVSRPLAWRLAGAYPNPAHGRDVMHLPVDVPAAAGDARLEIVDAANQVVRHFELHPGVLGQVRIDWDGANDHGAACAPGVYRAWLVAGDSRQFVRIARVP